MDVEALQLNTPKRVSFYLSAKLVSWLSFGFFSLVALLMILSQDIHADDAYMFYRYAYNLHTSGLFTWNPADGNTFGITSLFHFFFVDIVYLFIKNPDLVLKIATYIPIELLLLYIYRIYCVKKQFGIKEYMLVNFIIGYMFLCRTFQIHATSGMDTMLAFMLYIFFVLIFYQSIDSRKYKSAFAVSFCAILMVLTRPDSLFFLAGFFTSFLLVTFRNSINRLFILRVLLFCSLLGLIVLGLLILIFKDPLPLPFYVKWVNEYEKLSPGVRGYKIVQITHFILYAAPLLPFLFFIKKLNFKIIIPVLIGSALLSGYFYTVTWIMGYEFRFLFPLYGVIVATLILHVDKESIKFTRIFLSYMVILILNQCLTLVFRKRIEPLATGRPYLLEISKELATADDNISIAGTEHGITSALNLKKYIYDLSGLHNPDLKKGFNVNFMHGHKPDLIIMPSIGYLGMVERIRNDSVFKNEYYFISENDTLVKSVCRRMWLDGMAIKKSSPYFIPLEAIVQHSAVMVKDVQVIK